MSEPERGLVTDAKVIRVIDGDTVEVEITRRFPVRLIHGDGKQQFNAPEKREPGGIAAKVFLRHLLLSPDLHGIPTSRDVTLFIPAQKDTTLTDINSFNRLLGKLWVDGQCVTDVMLGAGHAKLES